MCVSVHKDVPAPPDIVSKPAISCVTCSICGLLGSSFFHFLYCVSLCLCMSCCVSVNMCVKEAGQSREGRSPHVFGDLPAASSQNTHSRQHISHSASQHSITHFIHTAKKPHGCDALPPRPRAPSLSCLAFAAAWLSLLPSKLPPSRPPHHQQQHEHGVISIIFISISPPLPFPRPPSL